MLSLIHFLVLVSCATLPDFPFPEATIIENHNVFDSIKNHPQELQNGRVQLAGRIIRSEETSDGVRMLAEWLPFPEDTFAGPETRSSVRSVRPFYMYYKGTIDHDGKRQGNEFLMVGTVRGLREMVTLQGLTKTIPAIRVQCLHVWKTAGTDLYEFIWTDPTDDRYPPPLEETYCVSLRDKEGISFLPSLFPAKEGDHGSTASANYWNGTTYFSKYSLD